MPLELHEDVIAEAIVDVIKAQTETLRARMDWLADENAVLKTRIKALEEQPPVIGPQGEKGSPGERGEIGPTGQHGTSVTIDDIRPEMLAEMKSMLDQVLEKTPAPKDGRDGVDGRDGKDGRDGLPGVPGATGEKGIDGKDGARGPAGLDGQDATPENLKIIQIDRRTWRIAFKDSGKMLEGEITLDGVPAWTGLFADAKDYTPGDLVRWGGSVYIAKNPGVGITPGTNGISEQMWDVFSERGRQGKTGDKGLQGDPGPRGEKGDRGPERW